jgi:ferric iron reductase protein FhuF
MRGKSMESQSVLHPLQQTLARVHQRSAYIKGCLGLPDSTGWVAPTAFFAPDSTALTPLIDLVRQRYRTSSPNTIGGVILQAYQWPLIATAVAAYVFERRVPDLSVHNVRLLVTDTGDVEEIAYVGGRFAALPDDPAADHPDALILPDQATLREHLRRSLEAHVCWLLDQLSAHLRCNGRALWLFVTDRCVSTLSWLLQEHDKTLGLCAIEAEVNALIHAPGSKLSNKKVGLFELTYKDKREVFMERATCCYWYKLEEGDYCTTCPHRPRAERHQRLLEYLIQSEEKAESHA